MMVCRTIPSLSQRRKQFLSRRLCRFAVATASTAHWIYQPWCQPEGCFDMLEAAYGRVSTSTTAPVGTAIRQTCTLRKGDAAIKTDTLLDKNGKIHTVSLEMDGNGNTRRVLPTTVNAYNQCSHTVPSNTQEALPMNAEVTVTRQAAPAPAVQPVQQTQQAVASAQPSECPRVCVCEHPVEREQEPEVVVQQPPVVYTQPAVQEYEAPPAQEPVVVPVVTTNVVYEQPAPAPAPVQAPSAMMDPVTVITTIQQQRQPLMIETSYLPALVNQFQSYFVPPQVQAAAAQPSPSIVVLQSPRWANHVVLVPKGHPVINALLGGQQVAPQPAVQVQQPVVEQSVPKTVVQVQPVVQVQQPVVQVQQPVVQVQQPVVQVQQPVVQVQQPVVQVQQPVVQVQQPVVQVQQPLVQVQQPVVQIHVPTVQLQQPVVRVPQVQPFVQLQQLGLQPVVREIQEPVVQHYRSVESFGDGALVKERTLQTQIIEFVRDPLYEEKSNGNKKCKKTSKRSRKHRH